MPTGDVEITILDGGAAVVVPGASVQVVIGCAGSGTAAQVIATQNPNTLVSNLDYGPLPEAAALPCLAGGTVLALRAATITAGSIRGAGAVGGAITAATNATPIAITTTTPHGLVTGAVVTVASVVGNTAANGTFKITKTGASTFTLDGSVGNSAYVSGGTTTAVGINEIASGTSVVTISGTPKDDYYIKMVVLNGGTVGTTGITFKVSLDAGRNYGPTLALGTATTYVIQNTGMTLAFAAGTLVANDYVTSSTIAPATDGSSIQACLAALQASPYAVAGWGSMHIVGVTNGSLTSTEQGYLDTLQTGFIYTRGMVASRDASPPAIWGGTAETEATWLAAVALDFSATDAKRMCVNGGYYNMPSAFPNPSAGSPSFRRPLSFALAAREVAIPPQRHAGRVRDGALSNIVVNPTTDPSDGFIYHDERLNPGLDAARFCSARTRIGLPGWYIVNPKLMSALGSVFTLLPLGNVMDIACAIVHQAGQQYINDDIRLNVNGTIYENEALAIENALYGNIYEQMIATSEISAASVQVNRTNNILATSIVKITVSITARGYVLEEDITIGFSNPFAAGAA